MARISGVNLPTNKRVKIALTYIYGIGSTIANEICKTVGISDDKRVSKLTDDEVVKIMRENLKRSSFNLWRKRVRGRKTKHTDLRTFKVGRHHSHDQNKHK